MSKNINQVYIANPITSNASTDLMYFGQSPYGAGNDAAMTYANFALQFAPPGMLIWSSISGTTQAAAINSGYIPTNSSLTTITLPATASIGSVIAVAGEGSGGWNLTANTGQTIKVASTSTSSGGSLASTSRFDAIFVVCVVANTTWVVINAITTGFTVV